MIKARGTNEKGKPLLLLGLSFGNIERLMDDKPIRFDGTPYGFQGEIMIMAGKDEQAIARKIAGPETMVIPEDDAP